MRSETTAGSGIQASGRDTWDLTRRRLLKLGGAAVAGAALGRYGISTARAAESQAPAEVIYAGEVFDAGGETLRIAEWGGFWEDAVRRNLLDQFEVDFNCTVTYDSAWPWFPKFVAGGVDNPPFDVSNWNLPELYKTSEAGDFFVDRETMIANIPKASEVWEFAIGRLGISWDFTQFGFAYRTDVIPAVTDFGQFWDEALANQRATYITSNSLQHTFFMAAAKYFGADEKDIDAGVTAMQQAMPMKITDFTGTMQTLLERGEVAIGVQHDAEAFLQIDAGVPLAWFPWDHWKPMLNNTKVVSRGSSELRRRLSYALIDRTLAVEFQEAIARDLYLRPVNRNATIPEELAKFGIVNSPDAQADLVTPDWDWWNENEQVIVEQVNAVFGS